jgi:hypothetical protein
LIVNAASYDSIREAVQDCFDNIGFPLQRIGEEDEDDEELIIFSEGL